MLRRRQECARSKVEDQGSRELRGGVGQAGVASGGSKGRGVRVSRIDGWEHAGPMELKEIKRRL